jgi:O-antigen/teichoic acid export membrane protein
MAFYLLALSIPIITSSTGLKGVLEARHQFGLVNAVRIPLGVYTFAGPLLVLPWSHSLAACMLTLIIGRILAWVAQFFLCLRVMPQLRDFQLANRATSVALLRFGGWLSVTNIVSPLMVYLDRFVIGALISVTAVAYYATPYELITKLSLVAGALTGVLFPTFAATFAHDRNRSAYLFGRSFKYLFLVLFPISVIVIALAHEILRAWLGNEFAQESTRVLQWLTLGVFVNNLAQLPSAFLQGTGRPDLTAKLHLLELPLYLLILWWGVNAIGIEGAAIAWSARVTIDALLLFALSLRLLQIRTSTVARMLMATGILVLSLSVGLPPGRADIRIGVVVLVLSVFVFATWRLLLTRDERMAGAVAFNPRPLFERIAKASSRMISGGPS